VSVFWNAFEYEPEYTVLVTFLACYPLWSCVLAMFGAVASTLRRSPKRWYVPEPGGIARAEARYPVVSVVIPAHNEEAVIAKAIERVLAIRWPEIDVIVVDDGSRDATRAAVRPYIDAGRVRLPHKEVNEGKSRALNDALGLCRGELFLVVAFGVFWLVAVAFGHGPPQYSRALALFACIVLMAGAFQAIFGILIDLRWDPGIKRQLPWAAWFPLAYWLMSVLTVVRATIPGLVRRPHGVSVWDVPRVRQA
jgi:Glycosyl transferase family 2